MEHGVNHADENDPEVDAESEEESQSDIVTSIVQEVCTEDRADIALSDSVIAPSDGSILQDFNPTSAKSSSNGIPKYRKISPPEKPIKTKSKQKRIPSSSEEISKHKVLSSRPFLKVIVGSSEFFIHKTAVLFFQEGERVSSDRLY